MGPSSWAKRELDKWPGFMSISIDIYLFKIYILQIFFEHLPHFWHCVWFGLDPEGMKMTRQFCSPFLEQGMLSRDQEAGTATGPIPIAHGLRELSEHWACPRNQEPTWSVSSFFIKGSQKSSQCRRRTGALFFNQSAKPHKPNSFLR